MHQKRSLGFDGLVPERPNLLLWETRADESPMVDSGTSTVGSNEIRSNVADADYIVGAIGDPSIWSRVAEYS